MNRRKFLGNAAAAGLALSAAGSLVAPRPRARAKDLANGRIVVCCTGVKGRGNSLFNGFGAAEDVDVKYVCDIDSHWLGLRQGEFESKFNRRPQAIGDYRQALDDKGIDAIVLGTPDHWHALPTIHACQAGKDVYTEKPDGHNLVEGLVMSAAAKKYGRVVQLGTQARSDPALHELLAYVKQGVLGRVVMAKAWESMQQKNLGKPADTDPPPTIDYDVWLGPAPKRPFNPLRFHGNWRWFFDYGAGDLANDGVHRLDFARWFLEAAVEGSGEKPIGMPRNVSASGGKYYFDDAQEWPDTMLVTYDYPGRLLTYEMRVWAPYPIEGEPEGAAIFGDEGYLIIGGGSWRHFGRKGVLVKEGKRGTGADQAHIRNFLDCMRSRGKPNADLDTVGRQSSLLCHLGNIAWRVGRTVKFDYDAYQFVGDDEANALRTRAEYRKPYVLPKVEEV
ncbi:MAG: Gfo/Idh/MocA family oxidoreductase [Planctomycetes bacterium]|nr:Gfo/Idh/MocA family oxidoreductase [Planctomycetota bacterium]